MSDFGNTTSPSGDIGPDAPTTPYVPASPYDVPSEPPAQESPMNPAPSLNDQEQSDMNAISEAFDRARNAIISSSQLAKEVEALRRTVEDIRQASEAALSSLRAEVTKLSEELTASRERNAMLDEHLVHARRQRDEERDRSCALSNDLTTRTHERDRAVDDLAVAKYQIEALTKQANDLNAENDVWMHENDKLKAENEALRAKLAAIQAVFAPAEPTPRVADPYHTAQF